MKKGFSLIETLVVMSIIAILFSCSISLVSLGRKISSEDGYRTCSIEIVDFINSSKHYCMRKGTPGYIVCDTNSNTIKFICNTHLVYRLSLPKGFILGDLNAANGMILINSRGISGSACTIKYEDDNKDLHLITMRVGTSYVEIQQ
jgi:prepilin-type N-terminal cleavage/methylation domain-containing protein